MHLIIYMYCLMSYFSYNFAKTVHFANSKYDYIKLEDITYINK